MPKELYAGQVLEEPDGDAVTGVMRKNPHLLNPPEKVKM